MLEPFAPVFSQRVWERAKVLVVGALLTPGRRNASIRSGICATRPSPAVDADSAYAVLDLLVRCQRLRHPVTVVMPLRLDAALYDPPPERTTQTNGRPRKTQEDTSNPDRDAQFVYLNEKVQAFPARGQPVISVRRSGTASMTSGRIAAG